MSKRILYFMIFMLLACDTKNNIEPIGDRYFIKFYGTVGKQQGVALQPTPDGGYIIGGNSISEFNGTSDYLLMKVDAFGNQEWLHTYDFDGNGGHDQMTEVLVDDNSYIIAGTSHINSFNKIVLLRVDSDGIRIPNDELIVEQNESFNYRCTGVTRAISGNLVVVGSTDFKIDITGIGNSILSVYENNFSPIPNRLKYSGLQAVNITHVKGFEVVDATTQEITYLAFGFRESANIEIGFTWYDDVGEFKNASGYTHIFDSKTEDVIPIENGNFMILGSSKDRSTLSKVTSMDGYGDNVRPVGQEIKLEKLRASGIAQSSPSEFIVSGTIKDANSENTVSTIIKSNNNSGTILWQQVFGVDGISYNSGKVIVLADGAIVYTGTAGFKNETKAFLIKFKSNGNMK